MPRQRERHPARGYALAAAAAAMWALNGSMARYLLDDGVGPFELSEMRSLGSWLILLVVLGTTRPHLLRVERDELPALAFLGVAGLAAVHACYFAAIERLDIGPAVTIQYLAAAAPGLASRCPRAPPGDRPLGRRSPVRRGLLLGGACL